MCTCYNVLFPCLTIVKKSMRQIMRVEIKSNSFLNFSDSAVSEAILNQVSFSLLGRLGAAESKLMSQFHSNLI